MAREAPLPYPHHVRAVGRRRDTAGVPADGQDVLPILRERGDREGGREGGVSLRWEVVEGMAGNYSDPHAPAS